MRSGYLKELENLRSGRAERGEGRRGRAASQADEKPHDKALDRPFSFDSNKFGVPPWQTVLNYLDRILQERCRPNVSSGSGTFPVLMATLSPRSRELVREIIVAAEAGKGTVGTQAATTLGTANMAVGEDISPECRVRDAECVAQQFTVDAECQTDEVEAEPAPAPAPAEEAPPAPPP